MLLILFLPQVLGIYLLMIAYSAFSAPEIAGVYKDPDGGTAEFLDDGTAIVTHGSNRAALKWVRLDDRRLKLDVEQGQGLISTPSAICDYELTDKALRVTGCPFAMRLNRQ